MCFGANRCKIHSSWNSIYQLQERTSLGAVTLMLGLLKRIKSNEDLAFAVVGQALLDEGSILTDKIEVFYNDRRTAWYLFDIASSAGLASKFRTKLALGQRKFGFTIVRAGWARLYLMVGPLPDTRKDLAFRFLLRVHSRGPMRAFGESKKLIIRFLREKPGTSRELCYALGISGSTIRRHLYELACQHKVRVIGKNINSESGKNKAAFVWSVDQASRPSSIHKCEAVHPQKQGRGGRVVIARALSI